MTPTKEQQHTIFMAGIQAGAQLQREHPNHDLWEHTGGSRAELAFERWYAGLQEPVVQEA